MSNCNCGAADCNHGSPPQEIIKDNSLDGLGLKARKFVEKYTWETITDDFEKILEQAIKERKYGEKPQRL